MKPDWLAMLRNLLQVMAFCLFIAFLQWAFMPERDYGIPMLYSVSIGLVTWAWIDIGRHLLPSSAETGWPAGLSGMGLVVSGILAGYLVGTWLADQWFGWSSWAPGAAREQLRASILVTVLAGVAVSYYFYSTNKSAWLIRKMTEAQRHATESRLKLLETQLEPHMLFNTLANLRVLIGTDTARAQVMLDHMIAYLRATLGASRATMHPLQAEFARLRDYLELMAIRMGPRLAYSLSLPPALAGQSVPTLLLQPLVENSIKHGLEPKVQGGRIDVSARLEGAMLVLEVIDSGVGPAGTGSGSGFGLAQVRERLVAAYEQHASVAFSAAPEGGARCTIRLPAGP